MQLRVDPLAPRDTKRLHGDLLSKRRGKDESAVHPAHRKTLSPASFVEDPVPRESGYTRTLGPIPT